MRILGTRNGFGALAVVAALSGLMAGALLWAGLTVTPKPLRNDAATNPAARPAPTPSARLGELLVSPPSFGAGLPLLKTATSQPSVVTASAQVVRVLGVARLGRSGRALVSDATGKSRWIRVGQCDGPICVSAVGRSSAILTVGGVRQLVDIFRQERRQGALAAPVIVASPSGPPSPPPPPSASIPGMVEPTLPKPAEGQTGPQGGA